MSSEPRDDRTYDDLREELGVFWAAELYEESLEKESHLLELLMADPDYGPDHLMTLEIRGWRAVSFFSLKRLEEALPEFEQVAAALAVHPSAGPAAEQTVNAEWRCANCLLQLYRLDEALAIFKRIDEEYRDHPDFGPDHPQISSAREMRKVIVENLVRDRTTEAERRAGQGDLGGALDGFGTAVEAALDYPHDTMQPTLLQLYVARSVLLERLGREGEALEDLNRSIELPLVESPHPEYGPRHEDTALARQLRAQLLNKLGRNREALPEFARAKEAYSQAGADPTSKDVTLCRLHLASTMAINHRAREALEEVESVLVGVAETESPEEHVIRFAEEVRNSALQLVPPLIEMLTEKAIAAHEEERFESELACWSEVAALSSRLPDPEEAREVGSTARRNRTIALRAVGQDELAEAEWTDLHGPEDTAEDGGDSEPPPIPSEPLFPLPPTSSSQQRQAALSRALAEVQKELADRQPGAPD